MSSSASRLQLKPIIIAISSGLLCLILSPYGIKVHTVEFQFHFLWSVALPIIVSLAYGGRYGLIAALSGAAWYPFLLWPQEGYTNLLYAAFLLWYFFGTGELLSHIRSTSAESSKKMMVYLSASILAFFTIAFLLLYKPLLSLNPPFWSNESITNIPNNVLFAFTIKDTINFIFIIVVSELLLKLPTIRKLLGIGVSPMMQNNMKVFIWACVATLLMWFTFYGLDYLIVTKTIADDKGYRPLVLLIIIYTAVLVARILIGFLERRMEVQMALKCSEEKYRILSENATDLIVLVNESFEIVYLSPSVKITLGAGSSIKRGEKLTQFVHPDDVIILQQYLNHVMTNNNHGYLEHRIQKEDQSYIWAESNGNKVEYHNTPLIQLVTRDISSRKKMEETLYEAMCKAEESDKLKSAFLANISHEIRTPMNGIMGFANLLLAKNEFDDKNGEYLSLIIENSNRLMELVNDIIDISVIESGKLNLIKKPINIHHFLDELLSLSYPYANKKKLTITAEIPDIPSPIIEADKSRLKQVFYYLIQNAIKFTDKGTIKIGYKAQADYIEFYISDTGIGIPPEQVNHIFDRFRQVENEYSKLKGGTGLGLAICKHIVELWGGNIKVDSKPEEGSTFMFTIPKM